MEPPRRRGKVLGVELHAPANGITPAQAGKRHSMHQRKASAKDHPRVGGEKIQSKKVWIADHGSPPRRRGKVDGPPAQVGRGRITPAQAGKRPWMPSDSSSSRDHPRMGGEKKGVRHWWALPRGSPPRGRGKGTRLRYPWPLDRITPAWAGKSSSKPSFSAAAWDHPRVGGEKTLLIKEADTVQGSPPRGRGKARGAPLFRQHLGITPAWAGKRR